MTPSSTNSACAGTRMPWRGVRTTSSGAPSRPPATSRSSTPKGSRAEAASMNSGCAPITIATGIGWPRSVGHLQQPPEVAARMQAGGQLGLRVQHRAVVAQIADAGVGMLGDDHRVGDVGRAVGLEVLAAAAGVRRSMSSPCSISSLHRAALDARAAPPLARARLVGRVQAAGVDAEQPADALARGEHVGRDRARRARRRASNTSSGCRPPAAKRGDDGGDLLVVAHRLGDDEHVLGMLARGSARGSGWKSWRRRTPGASAQSHGERRGSAGAAVIGARLPSSAVSVSGRCRHAA